MLINNVQVLLVTGGLNWRVNSGRLDSTELLLPSANSWSYSGALPSPRYSLEGATLDNKVVVIGRYKHKFDTLIFYVTFYFTNITILYTMQGAGKTSLNQYWTTFLNMTRSLESGTRLE